MAAVQTPVVVRVADLEPFATFVKDVTAAGFAFRGMTKAEAESLPARAAEGVTRLQQALRKLALEETDEDAAA